MNYKTSVKVIILNCILLFLSTFDIKSETNSMIIPMPVKFSQQDGVVEMKDIKLRTIGFASANLVSLAEAIIKPYNNDKNNLYRDKYGVILYLQIDPSVSIPSEGYRLTVNDKGIQIIASTESGIFYGLQSLSQLLTVPYQKEQLGFLEIEDYPRFSYRGLQLDVGRHIFPVEFIKKYLDMMAQYKLNTFHWHLTGDQGWRIEIDAYPNLMETGAYRDQTLIGHFREKPRRFDGLKYGGYYSKEEMREVVAYAASKYITVIPEVEMPGHATAALASYPHLACESAPDSFKVAEYWGVHNNAFCAGKEETFGFLEKVLDEVIEIFPSEYIHIGGDECKKDYWKQCSDCQKRMKKNKLKNEDELQSYFIERVEKYLNKKGRQIIGWDEILEGGIAPNATLMSWRGVSGGIAAAQQHHDVIMTPNTYLYFDYPESTSDQEPLTIHRVIPLEKVYAYNPVSSSELTSEQQKYIKGIQACVWTEYARTPEKAAYLTFPRFYALSEVAWTQEQKKNWEDFSVNRLPNHLAEIDADNFNYRVPTPLGAEEKTIQTEKYTVDFKPSVKGAKVYFSLDGRMPSENDFLLSEPVTINVPKGEERIVKSLVITPSGKRSIVVTTILSNM